MARKSGHLASKDFEPYFPRENGVEGMKESEWLHEFAVRLEHLMYERGISRSDLAKDAGISTVSLCRYLNKQRVPELRSVINLAHVLDIDPSVLIDFGELIE